MGFELDRRPTLERPLLLAAFKGWNDAGESATTALAYLCEVWGAERIGGLDPDDYLDFQVSRPTVRMDGERRVIDWPSMDLFHARVGGRDVLLFLGVEPNMRWRGFTADVLELALDLRVEMLVTFGAFLGDAPHTRPAPVAAATTDSDLMARLDLAAPNYEGPTGIVGVLNDEATQAGIRAVSVWAASPHYVASGSNPRAALALIEAATPLLGVPVDTDRLDREAGPWETDVTAAIEDDDDMRAYVRRLEELADDEDDLEDLRDQLDESDADAIAAEVERFLRDQPGDR
jgi:predicted ATP-grasp superfamily ATP-dependent carboligase